ncbi:hypothetical protein [Sphingobacterium sp. DR205]|uniref:hypothetical protein n=1 Tax=Sphingobacterium sp. DR205 TaxID=2713573 RepID=UPI0013E49241|nr:hypothetical protein [Sphingobacterium sp. DR205]QIH35552.1 hypothetical protein G6053_22915 [Sphingobacterium sp. DR205]
MVRIENRPIPLQNSEINLRLRCYYLLQVEGPLPVFYWIDGGRMMGGTPEQDDGQIYPGAVHGFDWYIPKEKMAISFLQKRINAIRLALESSKTAINN